MATYNPNNLSSDELTCPICFEEFSMQAGSDFCPKLLLCLHTFCLSCMKNLLQGNGSILCSICRTLHKDVYLNDLLDNYVILEYLRKKQEENDAIFAREQSELLKEDHLSSCRQDHIVSDHELARQLQRYFDSGERDELLLNASAELQSTCAAPASEATHSHKMSLPTQIDVPIRGSNGSYGSKSSESVDVNEPVSVSIHSLSSYSTSSSSSPVQQFVDALNAFDDEEEDMPEVSSHEFRLSASNTSDSVFSAETIGSQADEVELMSDGNTNRTFVLSSDEESEHLPSDEDEQEYESDDDDNNEFDEDNEEECDDNDSATTSEHSFHLTSTFSENDDSTRLNAVELRDTDACESIEINDSSSDLTGSCFLVDTDAERSDTASSSRNSIVEINSNRNEMLHEKSDKKEDRIAGRQARKLNN